VQQAFPCCPHVPLSLYNRQMGYSDGLFGSQFPVPGSNPSTGMTGHWNLDTPPRAVAVHFALDTGQIVTQPVSRVLASSLASFMVPSPHQRMDPGESARSSFVCSFLPSPTHGSWGVCSILSRFAAVPPTRSLHRRPRNKALGSKRRSSRSARPRFPSRSH